MKKVAIIIGHSKFKQGARNKTSGVTEFMFNKDIANMFLIDVLFQGFMYDFARYKLRIFERKISITKMTSRVNKWKPDIVISLHCNAFDTTASGTEAILQIDQHDMSNEFFKHVNSLVKYIAKEFRIKNRGIVFRTSTEAGGYMLSKLECENKALIEPFFIDNDKNFKKFSSKDGKRAYFKILKLFIEDALSGIEAKNDGSE